MFSSIHVPRIVRSHSHTPQNMRGTSAHCIDAISIVRNWALAN